MTSADPERRLTVTLDKVSVQVHDVGEDFAPTCLSVLADLIPFRRHKPAKRTILHDVSCQVRPGEMPMLVCGRPGSGCTTLLKIISNSQEEFEAVSGKVHYGSSTPNEAREFRGHIVMNTEDDVHFPTLKVDQTMDFATSTKLPKGSGKEHITSTRDFILGSLGIGHTISTMVGNETVRGVSGGERKRVSLAEVMATQALVQCWDNSTRGLDASNAFDFGRLLRKAADEQQKTIAATLYQAGNGVYDQFDKVLVLAEGRQIYYGPASEARQYFEDMGFICPPGANIGDFVTSVAVHTERKVRPGCETAVPDTPEEFEERFCASSHYHRMIKENEMRSPSSLVHEVHALARARNNEKNRSNAILSREKSPYQVSFFGQVVACTIRQIQVMWGDRWSNTMQIASAMIMALTTGSLFYNLPEDSTSIFPRPGAIFFPILFFALNKMSETTASFMGRRIVSRHKRLAFSRPSAFAIACMLTDIPLIIFTFTLFQIIFYFMTGQRMEAGVFFTSWIILILCTLCFASLYRMIGAWCKHFGFASQISGWITMVYLLYGGYLIPVPTMHPWFRWITYLNPATYTYEALMANEMSGMILDCVEPQLVPYGPSYNDMYHGCTVKGTIPGTTSIDGSNFLQSQYLASANHIGRNAGIIIAFWIFFAVMTAVGFEVNLHFESGSKILFTRKYTPKDDSKLGDLEKADGDTITAGLGQLKLSKTLFTFKDISYFVHHEGKEIQLLDKVSGYVKPGQLVALMGSSGAGKTTLMDVLAQRKDSGKIEGSILVNGKPQSITFQRTTGYCEQNDIHEPTATVWESLVFAASLRQDYQIPITQKLEYVVAMMDLLELTPLRDAIVGSPGSGLSIEQRKRLTLATELVAKPTLLFLDEPTSGLDGQSAHEICRFMRKLASYGQAVICTIHQPSATLFDAFDVLLLLARGGRTTYFGPTGQNSATVIEYFARNCVPCPSESNPAEHIVDVVQGRFGTEIDWPQMWLDSPERAQAMLELEELNAGTEADSEKVAKNDDDTAAMLDQQASFATPLWYQTKLVTRRQVIALWRNPDYIWNKIGLHVTNGLFGGFTFWQLGQGTFDLQLRLMAMLNFIFVAPGCINQMQPLFIQNRDIFEAREKKSKTYHWAAFVAGQLFSEIPALILCGTLAFVTWYFTVGFPVQASLSGQVYFQMLMYEFLYTSIGQAIAAYSPNAFFAALANPIILGAALINFCGVVVPYEQIQAFWRYWLYWLDPFTYLVQGLLTPVTWYEKVQCRSDELTRIPLPVNTTCGEFMGDFLADHAGYVTDPGNNTICSYCAYSTGADFLKTMNIKGAYYGWRSTGITALFCVSSYMLVFLMMKLRTKNTKTAS